MALTATKVAATASMTRYLMERDGAAGDSVSITQATLVADAAAGPLKTVLANVTWADLQTGVNSQIAINIIPRSGGTPGGVMQAVFITAPNILNVDAFVASTTAFLEVHFRHSLPR